MDLREKLRQTMLQVPSKKKTTAAKNLEKLFEDYPVVTNESQKLKMDVLANVEDNDSVEDGLNCQQ